RQRVALDDLDVRAVRQRLGQRADHAVVDLDGDDAGGPLGERPGQDPHAGPDLEHLVGWHEVGRREDLVEREGVDQEVLAEALARFADFRRAGLSRRHYLAQTKSELTSSGGNSTPL